MALYSKKKYEHQLEAVEAASSCVSAAIAGTKGYGTRLEPFVDDYIEMSEFFWARCPITRKKLEEPGPDVKAVARVFLALYRGKHVGGFEGNRMERVLERVRRKLKGKLLGARLILMDNDKKPKCLDLEHHKQPCFCKPMTLYRLAQEEKEKEAQL
jgi:hypothetical protein